MSTRIAPLVAALMIITPDSGLALEFDWGIGKCQGAE